MKASILLAAIAAQAASAHYFFDTNIVNGVVQPSAKYVRTSSRVTKYNPIKFSSNPAADIRDNSFIDKNDDARCNQGAFASAAKTEVLTVAAGDEVKFRLAVGATMQHPGPGLVYMSRAPNDNVKAYDGSGDWFKIFQEGVCNAAGDFTNNAWCTWDRDWIAATIPKNTPSGEYLVRVEHIGMHKSFHNQPEHYVSCLQVKVTGGGNGTPGPLVKFPGAYKDTDAYANLSIYGGVKPMPFPGPEVWNGTVAGVSVPTTTSKAAAAATTTSKAAVVPTTTSKAVSAPTTTSKTAAVPSTTSKATAVPTTTSKAAAATTSKPGCQSAGAGAPLYAQCGGIGFKGPTTCAKGKCVKSNDWFSQCV